MDLHRALGNVERARDLLVRLALAEQAQHVALARRQHRHDVGVDRRRRLGRARRLGQQQRRRVDAAAEHLLERRDHRLRVERLGDVAEGAGGERVEHVLALLRAGHDDAPQLGIGVAQLADRGGAVHARHRQIDDGEVDLGVGVEQLAQLRQAPRLAHFGRAAAVVEQQPQPGCGTRHDRRR